MAAQQVYVVTEDYGDWLLVGVYESIDGAKALAGDGATWELVDDVAVPHLRSDDSDRQLFITTLPLTRTAT